MPVSVHIVSWRTCCRFFCSYVIHKATASNAAPKTPLVSPPTPPPTERAIVQHHRGTGCLRASLLGSVGSRLTLPLYGTARCGAKASLRHYPTDWLVGIRVFLYGPCVREHIVFYVSTVYVSVARRPWATPPLKRDRNVNLLELQSRFGDKPVKFQVFCPQNVTAVLKGLRSSPYWRATRLLR